MKFAGTPGLVLPGGGARAAYQVGVLKAIAAVIDTVRLPFSAIAGVSAGAINAAKIAMYAEDFVEGVAALERVWAEMHSDDVFLMDYGSLQRFLSKTDKPMSLLDNSPLVELLHREIDTEAVHDSIGRGLLHGLAITASNYTTGGVTTFFQTRADVTGWNRRRWDRVAANIGPDHVLASSALPLLFPPQRIGDAFYVDGSLRMTAPLHPVINLGADRILVIGVRNEEPSTPEPELAMPGIGEVGGYMLESLFAENLNADMDRVGQINELRAQLSWWRRRSSGRRHIEVMVIRPSEDLRVIASRYAVLLPRGVRLFLRTVGGWGHEWRLPSYLLFEAPFTQALIDLGYRDGLKQRPALEAFFSA